jgi:sugar phosphate isomerase/epimerase
LALETGLEPGDTMSGFLSGIDSGGLGAALDPANFLMSGLDPYDNARALQGKVVYALAKDARQAGANRAAQEVPVGHGDIEWLRYLSVLEEIGYRGWLALKRDIGDNRLAELAAGMQFLRRLLGA